MSSTPAHGFMQLGIKPLRPKRKNHDRSWPGRPKVSACLSSNFPWEIIFTFIQQHQRSVIILQMVNKALYNTISSQHIFWTNWFNRNMFTKSYLTKKVIDPLYPHLSLYKCSVTGVPMHTGFYLANQPDGFIPYVRRVFSLIYGTRCGMCGCRHRHEIYWSLRMRVCKLCMAQNTISSQSLYQKYGVDYSDLSSEIAGRVFYFNMAVHYTNDRFAYHNASTVDLRNKSLQYMFWLPHLSTILDLPALRAEHSRKRDAAKRLTAAVFRLYIITQRVRYNDRHSVDCVLLSVYRNEKRRMAYPYKRFVANGGTEWAFPDSPISKKCKYTTRNGEGTDRLYRRLSDWEDFVV